MEDQPYHMRPWDEVLGPVLGVEEEEGHCLALIGKISVILPQDMAVRLKASNGQRIGILRTENEYRFRVIPSKADIGSKPLSVAQGTI
jgi:hypothetical protein